ncbi:MAG: type 2 isopentenyl-diphosphate Delta-isomerase [Planctomycetota bacterium]|jgi:isopentenyl-diphosphate delta-isomerase|nr:type 2 isopentenyl-diphosphate Delta-isomerase [Planctomycetota bacterium]
MTVLSTRRLLVSAATPPPPTQRGTPAGGDHFRERIAPILEERSGARVYLKLENPQRTGSFKLRGALNRWLSLDPDQRTRGVVAASSGNHGMAVTCAAGEAGVDAVVFVPRGASPIELAALRSFGARVRVKGNDCLVAEDAIRSALRVVVGQHRTLIEGAAAVAVPGPDSRASRRSTPNGRSRSSCAGEHRPGDSARSPVSRRPRRLWNAHGRAGCANRLQPADWNPMDRPISSRKQDHLRLALEHDVERPPADGSAFAAVELAHRALPELDLDEVDPSLEFLGRRLAFPLLIGSMTGGTPQAGVINRRLATAAQHCGVGMCLGSQRIALEHPEHSATFAVRHVAPDILLVANLGAVQLNYGVDAPQVRHLADDVGADAVVFHLNAAQEALQPEGDTRFGGLFEALGEAVETIGLPCGVKEVGCGFSIADVRRLAELPLAFLESAGRGGTSWNAIEGQRAQGEHDRDLAAGLADWGTPSLTSLLACLRYGATDVIASGGLRSGLDAARALALGATATAMALPLVRAAARSSEAVIDELEAFKKALVTVMFLTGARDLAALRSVPHRVPPQVQPEIWEDGAGA